MTIDKAIDRNVEVKGELTREGRLEKARAVQLGIEALKDQQSMRIVGVLPEDYLLPSETKD